MSHSVFMKDRSCKWFIPCTFISPAACCLVSHRPFAWWHHLLLRPQSFRVFLSCANYGFWHSNLAEITKFKYEKKNEKGIVVAVVKWRHRANGLFIAITSGTLPGNYDAEKVSIFSSKKSSNGSKKSCIFHAISECEAVQMLFCFFGIESHIVLIAKVV